MASVCRACGGDGLSPALTPRQAQVARVPFHLTRPDHQKAWRGSVSYKIERSSMTYAGPLIRVLDEAKRLLDVGWEITGEADPPERDLACEWCEGLGDHSIFREEGMTRRTMGRAGQL